MEEKTMKNNQIDTENKKLEEAIAYFRQKNKAKIAEAKAETKPENTEKEDKVGYKQPPKKHQFQKGQSGNPKGRKKKPVPESLFEALTLAAHELADVFDPVTETYSKARKLDLLASRTIDDALKKDGPSRKYILENLCKFNMTIAYQSLVDKANQKDEIDPELSKIVKEKLQLLMEQAIKEQEAKEMAE